MQSVGPVRGQARARRPAEALLERGIAAPRKASRGLPVPASGRRLATRGPKGIWLGRLNRDRIRGKWLGLSLLFAASAVAYGAWVGGEAGRFWVSLQDGAGKLAVAAGLGIERVTIEGRRYATNAEITRALGASSRTVLLGFDTDAAKARLEAVPWIKHAQVMRWLPSTLQVVIQEREPYAIWQSKGRTYVVDAAGVVIAPALRDAYPDLPFVVGDGAGKHAKALYAELEDFADVKHQLLAALRVGDRRWTLKLMSGLEIMLPDDNIAEALKSLVRLDRNNDLLDQDIASVDLRLLDRVSVRLREPVPANAPDGTPATDVPTASTKAPPSNGKT